MGWFSDDSDQAQAYEQVGCYLYYYLSYYISYQVQNAPHKAELSHELIAAAASYEVSPTTFVLV